MDSIFLQPEQNWCSKLVILPWLWKIINFSYDLLLGLEAIKQQFKLIQHENLNIFQRCRPNNIKISEPFLADSSKELENEDDYNVVNFKQILTIFEEVRLKDLLK